MVFDMVTRSASDSCGPHGHYTHEALLTTNSTLPCITHPHGEHYGRHTLPPPALDEALQTCRGSRSLARHAMQVQLKIAIQ